MVIIFFVASEVICLDNLLILGAGQYSNIVYDIAKATEKFGNIDFLDDNAPKAIGKTTDAATFLDSYKYATVAMGNSTNRLTYLKELEKAGFHLPIICSPMAYISPSASIDKGSIIEPMAVIHSNAKIGKGCLICAGAVINHDAIIEDGCQIDCNAVVPSSKTVPEKTKLPCGCVFSSNK